MKHNATSKTKLNFLADRLDRHWIWKILISFFPSIWFPIVVKYFGVQFYLVKSEDTSHLTTVGMVCTFIIYGLSLGILIISGYHSKNEEIRQKEYQSKIRSLESTNNLSCNLLARVRQADINKNDNLLSFASEADYSDDADFICKLKPLDNLKNIADEIRNCIHEATSIGDDKLIVSMAYCLGESDWFWVDSHAVYGGLSLTELTTNQKTIFYQIKERQIDSSFVYINNKAAYLEKNMYVSDQRDKIYKNVGSLVCVEVKAEANNMTFARLIISISSYGKKFSNEDSNEQTSIVEENLNTILSQFEEKIITELTLLYLQENLSKSPSLI